MCFEYILYGVHLLKSLPSPPSQALQYLRKLCNHPSLVLTSQHPEYKRITEELASQNSNLRDIQHAPKLSALKQVKAAFIVALPKRLVQNLLNYISILVLQQYFNSTRAVSLTH